MGSKETVPRLLACGSRLDRIVGGGGERDTEIHWKRVLAWWDQTSFARCFRHTLLCETALGLHPLTGCARLGTQTTVIHGKKHRRCPMGSTEHRSATGSVSAQRTLVGDCSARSAEQTVRWHPLEPGAFRCGNARKITLRGVEGYCWQKAQENSSVCRGFQWVLVAVREGCRPKATISRCQLGGGRGELVQSSWVSDSSPIK